jgi:hypothetical protein
VPRASRAYSLRSLQTQRALRANPAPDLKPAMAAATLYARPASSLPALCACLERAPRKPCPRRPANPVLDGRRPRKPRARPQAGNGSCTGGRMFRDYSLRSLRSSRARPASSLPALCACPAPPHKPCARRPTNPVLDGRRPLKLAMPAAPAAACPAPALKPAMAAAPAVACHAPTLCVLCDRPAPAPPPLCRLSARAPRPPRKPRARRPADPAPDARKPRKPRRDQSGKSARLAVFPCAECNIVVGVDTLLDKFAIILDGILMSFGICRDFKYLKPKMLLKVTPSNQPLMIVV